MSSSSSTPFTSSGRDRERSTTADPYPNANLVKDLTALGLGKVENKSPAPVDRKQYTKK